MKRNILLITLLSGCFLFSGAKSKNQNTVPNKVWPTEKAYQWYSAKPWLSGCNFQPSTAINQIEMWQSETFDAATIDRELGWAEELGFKTMRVFLSSAVWNSDPNGFKKRINEYLTISDKHGISTMFVFFDDCWSPKSAIGKQPEPKPGVHNSGWVQDPSSQLRKDTTKLFPELEKYVKDIISTFKNDKRILFWDLYNEPGNSGHGITSLPLLKNTFKWAREINPKQPLSAGLWYFGCNELNVFQIENSDIVTYHNYADVAGHQTWINFLKIHNRPMICTEYMARRNNSLFQNIMPLLKQNNIGAINWGFVSGKTNTIFAWDEPKPNEKEPKLWFHDILRQDKTPFDQAEINLIKNMNGKNSDVKLTSAADFGGKLDGKAVHLYTLKNNMGISAQISNFGGRVVTLWTPDRNGKFADIVTGYNSLKDYQKSHEIYFGALIGRYGNRVANGKFSLNGNSYQLPVNNGKNTLHGGLKGFHNVVWDARQFVNKYKEDALELKHLFPDGEDGFPGNLDVTITYTLTNQNELKIEYAATTDRATVVNMTHHSFFNLHGFSEGYSKPITSHILQLNAASYTPTDEGLIPTGKIASVLNTPMDFRKPTLIGQRIEDPFQDLIFGKGYDHNWILDPKKQGELTVAAIISEPSNGRSITVKTNEPGLQFYSGNFFEGKDTGKYGEVYNYRTSFALETQHYPDSPNQPEFPTTELKPGEKYSSICIYKFDVVNK